MVTPCCRGYGEYVCFVHVRFRERGGEEEGWGRRPRERERVIE